MREDGSESSVIRITNMHVATILLVTHDYIFFFDEDSVSLWRMNLDGSNKVELKP